MVKKATPQAKASRAVLAALDGGEAAARKGAASCLKDTPPARPAGKTPPASGDYV